MSESPRLDDTFDNISLTLCGKNINNSKSIHHSIFSNDCLYQETEEENINKTGNFVDLSLDSNISFDDSQFLNEVLTPAEANENDSNIQTEDEHQHAVGPNVSFIRRKLHQNAINKGNVNVTEEQIFTCYVSTQKDALDQKPVLSGNSCKEILQNCDNSQNTLYNCELSSWGLPDTILNKYKLRNISSMFPWQAECLNNYNVLEKNSNLVYSAPTSAGKTLVAEILAIKTILERQKKVLFVLPFVSVVREKMFYFQEMLEDSGVQVGGFMGSHSPPGGFNSVQFAVCTIEKSNSIINRLLEEAKLSDIGTVIVDEMHLLGDPGRGYLLELLLTKLKYMCAKDETINIQIIGMSATLPNLHLLSKWLNAELFVTSYRPIPLFEQVHLEGEVFDCNLKPVRSLSNIPELETDTDNILQLSLETILNSCSVLIFCPTKNWCENLAQQISLAFWKMGTSKSSLGMLLREQLNSEAITELLEQLKRCPVGLDSELKKCISFAVAFHHAGLTMDERDIIESAFRGGTLRVLVATSTLSSGVNLPARRVIIRTPIFHGKPIDNLTYRQMIGRAGRMGKDSLGESFLICQKNQFKIAEELLSTQLPEIESCLEISGKLKRAVLEVIASGVATTPDEVKLFANSTLLAAENNNDELIKPIKETVIFLERNEFIRLQSQNDGSYSYIATSLGKACLSSSLPPEEGLTLFSELEKARQCFVLETELHLIYLVTPYNVCYQVGNLDWMLFFDLWDKLPTSMKRVGELVGIKESFIVACSRGQIKNNSSKHIHTEMVHKRFYTALALQELVNEIPLNIVAKKFRCSRGLLQSLQQSASTFAGMVTSFSRQLKWSSVELLISQFQDRLNFGVNQELLNLMKLPLLNAPQARVLYNAGIETLLDLAKSDACEVENILCKVVPFESTKIREGESKEEACQRSKFRTIWIIGKQGVSEKEAAQTLIYNARHYIQLEMGIKDIKWNKDKDNSILNESVKSQFHTSTSKTNVHAKENSINYECTTSMELLTTDKISNFENGKINFTQNNHKTDHLSPLKENKNEECSTHDLNDLDLSNSLGALNICDVNELPNSLKVLNICDNDELPNKNDKHDISDESLFGDSVSELQFKKSTKIDNPQTQNDYKLANCIPKHHDSSETLNSSDDFIENSQGDSFATNSIYNSVNKDSPYKRKRKILSGNLQPISPEFEKTPSKKTKYFTSLNTETVANKYPKKTLLIEKLAQINFESIEIVNICKNEKLFDVFCREIKQQNTISFSLACVEIFEEKQKIGADILKKEITSTNTKYKTGLIYKNRCVEGVALSWGRNVCYYVSFTDCRVICESKKLKLIAEILTNQQVSVRIFDCKEHMKVLKLNCNIDFHAFPEDPKIADWILEPEGNEKNLQAMALKYTPETLNLCQTAGFCKGVGSVGLNLNSAIDSKTRASVESVVCWHLMDSIYVDLKDQNAALVKTFKTEMKSIFCLARMELHGFPVNALKLQKLAEDMKKHTEVMEKKAYEMAGRRFSITSSKDIANILGIYRGQKISTNKKVLEDSANPISDLIVQWRKVSGILTKMILPLIQSVHNNRIHGFVITHHSTGRISMQDPNLQNIAKSFEIVDYSTNQNIPISCRNVFECTNGYIFLSADYCQLELRILAHYSQDSTLNTIMQSKEDIFSSIAAEWNNVANYQVDDTQRQHAKQICYGIIYGIGIKTLSQQMKVSENVTNEFLQKFHQKYPAIKSFIKNTITKCNENGYVETLAGRRRYLPNIIHKSSKFKMQAERQAVNTTIQGSAADIAKLAMTAIEDIFYKEFGGKTDAPKLILNLHDEFLYEVPEKYISKCCIIVRKSMEEAVKLNVPLPVRLKIGSSWGALREIAP